MHLGGVRRYYYIGFVEFKFEILHKLMDIISILTSAVAYYYFFSSHVQRSIIYGDQPRNRYATLYLYMQSSFFIRGSFCFGGLSYRLDLHLPKNSEGSKPVVAFVTGGAWIIG